MFSGTRRWLRQNRTPVAIGVGVLGAGYLATQYVLTKINDARERMSSDRIAKENLRRRFEQNQEDCTFTVLALLPTATTNILEAMNTEQITYEIQQMKVSKGIRSGDSVVSPPSIADTSLTEEEGKSMVSLQSESGIHASQIAMPSPLAASGSSAGQQQDRGATPPKQKPSKSKRQLWDDLTISAVTRSFTLIYTLSLLTMLTRVQLNLLGRRSYLSSVVALATSSQQATISLEDHDDDNADQAAYGSDFDTNRKYLAFSWWLLNQGWVDVAGKVEGAVRAVFGSLSPRDLISFDRFSELTMEVRKLVEGGTPEERRSTDWLAFLLPPRDQESDVIRQSGILEDNSSPSPSSPPLRHLLDETADLIESPSFSHILTLLLDTGFSSLVDTKLASEAFDLPNKGNSSVSPAAAAVTGLFIPEDPTAVLKRTKLVLLPKILSVLTRQAHVIGNGMPNEYLRDMESVRELEAFAAVVYSSNWENEVRDEGHLMDSAIHVDIPDSSTHDEPPIAAATIEDNTAPTPQVLHQEQEQEQQSGLERAWERALDKGL
ncbi:peroxin-3 [Geosmithia morbida]|uniref:Peroxin-3 n=1 Tax=Geosmithia morbida TaxID=1094350 RepID=A0A9P5D734_9HYPO|nr:peroxin-3 [Geosmithia morbida]KAF4124129.1 peroxin-3 [Geosmithia morbida]